VREAAAEALGRIGNPAAVDALLAAPTIHPLFRGDAALKALGKVSDPRAVEALADAVESGPWTETAIIALAAHRSPRAVEALLGVLETSPPYLRRLAARSLGEIGDPQAVDGLTTALRDPESEVRAAATAALGKIGGTRAVRALLELTLSDAHMHDVALGAFQDIDMAALDGLTQSELIAAALACIDPLQQAALSRLTRTDDPRDLTYALKVLHGPNGEMRQVAAAVLGRLGGPQATAALLDALEGNDDDLRWAAVEALEELQDETNRPRLIAALSSPNSDVRRAAARALAPFADAAALTRLLEPEPDQDYVDDPGVRSVLLHAMAFSFWDRPRAEQRSLTRPLAALSNLDLAESIDWSIGIRDGGCSIYGRVLAVYPRNPVARVGVERLGCSVP
jgi:HEAT repeat protein